MSGIIQTPEGKIVGIDPTLYQGDHDAVKRENEAHNRKADKARAEIERKLERARQAQPTHAERMRGCIDGMKKFSAKTKRDSGDTKKAAKLAALADAAAVALDAYTKHEKKLKAQRPDHLGDAHKAAAAELRKVLPVCFPTENDALQFARRLPLIAALDAANKQADAFGKVARQRDAAANDFWAAVRDGGRLAFGGLDDDQNARRFIELGIM